MIATEPKVNPAGMYELAETAAALKVSKSTISRAAQKGLAFKIRRSNGRRIYRGQDIINYWRLTY